MLELAEPLHRRWFPSHSHRERGEDRIAVVVGEVIRKISERHSTADSLLDDVAGHIRRIKKFLRQRDFITLPPEDDGLVVEPTPGFLGGLAVAFFNPPPAFEPHLKKSYWISSVEGKPAEFVESYLREYNHYAMQSLTIHEAFPGHYVQFWHALNSPVASIYKKVLASNTFAEGWAVLCERLLFDDGYAADEPGRRPGRGQRRQHRGRRGPDHPVSGLDSIGLLHRHLTWSRPVRSCRPPDGPAYI